jgi:CHASE2 domain-containing sensor protein
MIMKHFGVRYELAVLLGLVAVFDLVYSVFVLTGVVQLSAGLLQGTPFVDFTVPMLLLAIVVGGSALLAAATVFIQHEWSVFLAAVAGLMMIAWVITEAVMVQQFAWFEGVFVAIGLVVIGLASYLWTTEYRSHHFPTRHVSHA